MGKIDVWRRTWGRRRQHGEFTVLDADEAQPRVGDVPPRPPAVGGTRPDLGEQRRRGDLTEIDRFAGRASDELPPVVGRGIDDDVSGPIVLLAAGALVVAVSVDDLELVEPERVVGEDGTLVDQAAPRGAVLARLGR